MSDRLNELLRQRALLQEHLAWLDAEIAAEMGRRGVMRAQPSAQPPPESAGWSAPLQSAATFPVGSSTGEGHDAEGILEKYREESLDPREDVRKGCFFYFGLALALLILAVAALYFYTSSHHPSGIMK